MSDTPNGETQDNGTPAQGQSTPPEVKSTDNAVEELRKQLAEEQKAREQATLRANQLENEKKQREAAEAERQAKELEEQNQYKELYEQERIKREEVERERQEAEQKQEIAKAKAEVTKEYDDTILAEAKELGFDLTSSDETAVAAYKAKLDKLTSLAGKNGKVGGDNPPPKTNNQPTLNREELQETIQTDKGFHDYVTKNFPGIAAMTNKDS